MSFWGSTVDASKAKVYELPSDDSPLPPIPATSPSSTINIPTSTKDWPKPTEHLPGDHGEAEGEASKPAFPGQDDATSPSMTPTPDEGWFPGMSKWVSNQKWFFIALGAVLIFSISVGVFFVRRRSARKRRANYSSLARDDVAMSSISGSGQPNAGGGRAKELYDAFGEVSDDEDEDADEETGLRPKGPQVESPGGRLAYHSGFLDDDEPGSAIPAQTYRDEPEYVDRLREADRSRSPSGRSDGDSWEHASQTR
jgi:kexin